MCFGCVTGGIGSRRREGTNSSSVSCCLHVRLYLVREQTWRALNWVWTRGSGVREELQSSCGEHLKTWDVQPTLSS